MSEDAIINSIKEGGKRSAWIRVLSPSEQDADAIYKDADLLRANWTESDARIIEIYHKNQCQDGNGITQSIAQRTYDSGFLSYNEFICTFFEAKKEALKEIENCE